MLDPSVKLVRDGLNVRQYPWVHDCSATSVTHQDIKCLNYQLAVQALSVDTKLHKLYDETRHEGKNEMDFQIPHSAFNLDAGGAGPALPCHSDADTSSDMSFSEEERESSDRPVAGDHEDHVSTVSDEEGSFHDPGYDDEAVDEMILGSDDEYVEEDDNEINMGAYDITNLDNNGLQKTEQAGVIHLVHGWTQQAHPDQVG
jgi:hypothetical protein